MLGEQISATGVGTRPPSVELVSVALPLLELLLQTSTATARSAAEIAAARRRNAARLSLSLVSIAASPADRKERDL